MDVAGLRGGSGLRGALLGGLRRAFRAGPLAAGAVAGRALAVLPAQAAAADLLVADAVVEGDRLGQGGEGGGLRADAGVEAEGFSEFAEDDEVRLDVAGAAGRRAHALEAAVGVGDGAVFLGMGLEREDDVGLGGGGV